MAQPVFYQTMNNVGIDPSQYSTAVAVPGGSVTPEYPAPPFLPGMQAFGTDGSQFVYVQASSSISLGDFVMINAGTTSAPYQASSITTTLANISGGIGIGATGLVTKNSVTFIPAGAYFWACTRGTFVPAQTNNGLAANAGSATASQVLLFTTTTAGVISSVTTSQSLAVALQGIVCINSITVSIAASLVPPVGTLTSTGFAQGPIVALNNPRTVIIWSSSVGALSLQNGSW